MALIIISIITTYAVLIAWTYYNMNKFENNKKMYFIIFEIIISFIITSIVLNINKINVVNEEISKTLNTINLMLFTPINALLIFPSLAKVLNKYKSEEITREERTKRIILRIIIFLILLVLEGMYIQDLGSKIFR